MSSSPPPPKIELREETEGDRASVSDLVFFHAVGEPIRIKPEASAAGDNGGGSDSADWLPTQPIAVSEKHGLIFIAHSSGFSVARTKDVMEVAKGKGSGDCYVTEMSLVNVDLENVRSLSLSRDSSVVAVCAGPEVRFFSVDLLLNKEEGSLRSNTIDESTFIKDFRWLKTKDNAFTILSGSGKLCNGSVGGPLKAIMDEVDAVECSLKGKSIVVARSNILSVLTTKFKETLCISLAVPSWMGESDGSYKVTVDSIRWVRPDSIVLGCFQLQSDGIEENYFLQVIRSKAGKITDISAEMVVQSFYYVFPGMIDDIVPPRNGPYLFLSYLEQCELAVTAHRKNTEEHMVFFSWSVSEAKDEVVFVEINRNKWLPKIELQENEEDNLILGLCSSKVSLDEKVRIQMSSDLREMELSPFAVIFSVTVEGKLVMHHISSNIELCESSDEKASEEEEDTSAMTPSVQSSARGSSTLVKGSMDHSPIGGQFQAKIDVNVDLTHKLCASLMLPSLRGSRSPLSLIIGSLYIRHPNLFGGSEKLDVSWNKGLCDSNAVIAYRRPRPEWLSQQSFVIQHSISPGIGVHGTPIDNFSRSGSGGVNLSHFSIGLDLTEPPHANWSNTTSIRFKHVRPINDDGRSISRDIDGFPITCSGTTVDSMVVLKQESRYAKANEHNFLKMNLQIEQGIPLLSKWIIFNQLKFVASKGVKLGSAFLVSSITAGSLVGDMAPYQAFAIGGIGSVRGYGEGGVGAGRSCLIANVELSFPLNKMLDGCIFLDCGTDLGSGRHVPGNPSLRHGKPGSGVGLGYGLRFKSKFGHFLVDYAVNAFQQKTVYFGISNVTS